VIDGSWSRNPIEEDDPTGTMGGHAARQLLVIVIQ